MNGNGLIVRQARTKVLVLEHARETVLRAELDHFVPGELAEPIVVVADFCFPGIENLVDLLEIRLCVCPHLLTRERRARFRLARGVAHHGREIADQENRGVAEVLKMLQLADHYGVAQVNIRRRGVHAQFDAQGFAGLARYIELGAKFVFGNDLRDAFAQVVELLVDFFEYGLGFRFRHSGWRESDPLLQVSSTRRPSMR